MEPTVQQLTGAVLDALPQAVAIISRSGRVLVRNAVAEQVLPEGDELHSMLQIRDESSPLDWSRELARLDRQTRELTYRDVWVRQRSGKPLLVDIRVRPVRAWAACGEASVGAEPQAGACGDEERALVMVDDVSERALMERRLATSERLAAVGHLAARVAHELNNPLDGILRYIGLAGRVGDARAQPYLDGAREGLTRMAGIIRDFVEQGRFGHAMEARETIERLLDEALAVMQQRAQALGVSIVCDLADCGTAKVDGRLFQVFCNVIKNALDAMSDGGLLKVRLRREGEEAVVSFADSGRGLETDDPEMVFRPFYTTKPAGEGSGLGLPICREIVTGLGGGIEAASRTEGGAEVTIRLPVWKTDGAARG
jgi:signal transduction histidine kinase